MDEFTNNIGYCKAGFTLIELMVVLAIVGLILAIAVPVYGKIQAKAEEQANEANIMIIEGAVQMYLLSEENGTTVGLTVAKLKEEGYLQDVPKPPGDRGEYIINSDGTVTNMDKASD